MSERDELLEMVAELRRALWENGAPEGSEEWKAYRASGDLLARYPDRELPA